MLDETKYSTAEGNHVQLKETRYNWRKLGTAGGSQALLDETKFSTAEVNYVQLKETMNSWRKPGTAEGNHV